MPDTNCLTIGQLAKAASVGVETIRYYQGRKLLPVPQHTIGYRRYPQALVARIRFIKRAQELGFSLAEIGHLLSLEESQDRLAIREIAGERLQEVRARLHHLQQMETVLAQLIDACASCGGTLQCPIIHALNGDAADSADGGCDRLAADTAAGA